MSWLSFTCTVLSLLIRSTLAVDTTNVTNINIQIGPSSSNSFAAYARPATQKVAAFINNGVVVIDGDINYATEKELFGQGSKRSVSIFTYQNLWPNGVIKYKWYSQEAKDGRGKDWTEATKRWTDMLPFLNFEDIGVINSTFISDAVTLVGTTGQKVCTSPIGKAKGWGTNFIALDDECGGSGTFAHELGHTLGLYHEQVRPDRNNYVVINCTNVMDDASGTKPNCGVNCTGLGCNFRINTANASDYSGPYDSLSIMHYAPREFSKNGLPVIVAKPGVPEPRGHSYPTATDARRVCDLYREECKGVCGDGIFSPENGEECDDGNNADGDGCSAACKKERPDTPGQPNFPTDLPNSPVPPGASTTATSTPTSRPQPSSTLSQSQGPSKPSETITPNKPTAPPTCAVQTCSPEANGCDISTSCVQIGTTSTNEPNTHLCACRAGFRASGHSATESSVQARFSWAGQEGRVFVKPGIQCNQLCDGWMLGRDGCGEVRMIDSCM